MQLGRNLKDVIRSRTAVSGNQFYQFQFNWTGSPTALRPPISWSRKAPMDLSPAPTLLQYCYGTGAHGRWLGSRDGHWPPIATFSLSRKGREETAKVMGKTLSCPLAGSSFPPQQVSKCGTRSGLLSDPSAVSAGGALSCLLGWLPSITIIKAAQRCGKSL